LDAVAELEQLLLMKNSFFLAQNPTNDDSPLSVIFPTLSRTTLLTTTK